MLIYALLEKIDDPANRRIRGLVLPQLSIAGEFSTSKKETHPIWAGWVSKTLLRYPHPGVRVQQHRTTGVHTRMHDQDTVPLKGSQTAR